MAARNQHVQDSAVAERRLRPIYEWLDSGNPKKALQETEKVLRKTPNLQCAKALKALSLLQLSRETECVTILNALTAETPSDNSTLQAMTICYRDLGQLEKVCNLYEKAIVADPTNEELHTHLFMSYVRTSNFKMQQQSAMALYKMKPKNPYYFWAVMSIVLQATRGQGLTDSNKRTVLLSLAERMVDKLINENKLEAEQEVQLYLMILELQGKYEQALAVLDGPLGTKLMSTSTEQNKISYLLKLEMWNDLNVLCNDLLSVSMDRWDIWNHYLTSMFELSKVNSHINNHVENHENNEINLEGPDDTPEKAHEFICSVIENVGDDNLFKSSSSYQLRGPYLARFELCSRLKKLGRDTTYLLGDTFELFVEYFRLFGHKPCCVSDLRVYLHLLEPERRIELASKLLKDVGISFITLPQSEKQMQRHICSLQLSRLCGSHANLDVEYIRALVAALSLHYQNGTRTFGAERLPTDQGPADAYALLAAHTLHDLAYMTQNSAPLVAALVLLESLLKASPSNFHAKLLCVRLYHLLGGGEGAQKMYESLDTKHLQMDSLGFVHCARLHTTGLFSLTASLYETTLKFFSTNYRDSIDHLTFSYKFGSFLKLEEFMDFRERLNNSLHYTITAIDRMILEMVLCPNLKGLGIIDASPKNNNIDWESLRDNNDYGVYLSWDPDRVNGPTDKSEAVRTLFEQDRDVTRIRAGILCGVSSALDILKASDENREQCVKTLTEVHQDWIQHFENVEKKGHKPATIQNHLSMPLVSRLHSHLMSPYKPILGALFRLVIRVATGGKTTDHSLIEQQDGVDILPTALTSLSDHVARIIREQNESNDALWDRRVSTELIVNCVEILCVSCVLCGVCCELARPAQAASTGRRGKKRAPNAAQAPGGDDSSVQVREQLSAAVSAVRRTCVALDQLLSSWHVPNVPGDLAERLGALAISSAAPGGDTDRDGVLEYIKSSHVTAVKELRAALASKIKFLNSLTC